MLTEPDRLAVLPACSLVARLSRPDAAHGARGARLIIVMMLMSIALLPSLNPAEAGCKRKRGDTLVSVPVFLATDRKKVILEPAAAPSPQKQYVKNLIEPPFDFGKQIIDPLNAMSYGITRADSLCTVPDDLKPSLVNSGWIIYPPDARDTACGASQMPAEFTPKIFEENGFEELCKSLRVALDRAPRKAIVVYVHGCCIDYTGSIRQAADLASSVKAPVVAYSWGCSNGYSGSTLAYPRTQERFNTFMIDLLKKFPDERIVLVGSSIGNNIIIDFCLQCRPEDYGNRRIDELIMSRADIDDIAFKSQIEHVKTHAGKIILYVAKNDFQINLSGTLRWFFYPTQHGERAGHLRAMLYTDPSLTVLDVSPLKLGHLVPYDSIDDLLQNGGKVPKDSLQYHYVHENSNLYRVKPQRCLPRTASRAAGG